MSYKPNPTYVLVAANAGVVYVGAVFAYMGSLAFDETIQVFLTNTMLSDAAAYFIAVGVLGMAVGCYGVFVTMVRTETHLSCHVKALGLLLVVFLGSCAVGLVMHLQSSSWWSVTSSFMKASQVAYVESFSQRMCPLALGYSCHAAKMNISDERYESAQHLLIPSLPSGPWYTHGYGAYVFMSGVNESVAAAFSNQPRNSGYFIDLCATVASRVQALGPAKRLGSELQRACSACQAVAPVQELPPWIRASGGYSSSRNPALRLTARINVACMDHLYPSEWTQLMRQNDIPDTYRSNDLLSSGFLSSWSDYSLAICISSGFMVFTAASLAYEARRLQDELFPPSS